MNPQFKAELQEHVNQAQDPRLAQMVVELVDQMELHERTEAERSRMPEPAARAVTGYLPWMKAVKG